MDTQKILLVLDAAEQRVLGSLMEKCKTTPDYYPMTLNSLVAACNQKTSRKPVVDYDEGTVIITLDSLKKRGLISTVTGGSSRVVKYKHNFAIVYPLVPADIAVICLLLLRGPQTPGEINTSSGRLYEFESLDEVQEVLEKLSSGEVSYIAQLPRRPGQKEVRYVHLFGNVSEADQEGITGESSRSPSIELEGRVSKLEQEFTDMKAKFDKFMQEWNG